MLNLHGNAITLVNALRLHGIHDAETLRAEIERTRGKRLFTFGVASAFSSHNFVLQEWLRLAGIDPCNDVEIVTVPPPQMFPNLRAGNLDGYCVGEPWNSLAVMSRAGWCVATSAELSPRHPEKVLMVPRDFAECRAAEHLALIAALIEACEFCDRPENRERIIETLAQPGYVDAPIHALRMSMKGTFNFAVHRPAQREGTPGAVFRMMTREGQRGTAILAVGGRGTGFQRFQPACGLEARRTPAHRLEACATNEGMFFE